MSGLTESLREELDLGGDAESLAITVREWLTGRRELLAVWLCETRYDCASQWATCDHGFGYRDADAILAHLQTDLATRPRS